MTTTLVPPRRSARPPDAEVEIDPRIEARRTRIREVQRRKHLWRLLWGLLAVAAATSLLWLSKSTFLDVDRVLIEGADRTAVSEVLESSGFEAGDPMLTADLPDARDAISALPWVDRVLVRRTWPATIRIEVQERVPVGAIERSGGGWFLIDASGHLLEAVEEPSERWLRLLGLRTDGHQGQHLDEHADPPLIVADTISPGLRQHLSAIEVGERGELWLGIVLGGRVRLGDTTELDAKLLVVETILTGVDDRCLDVVDVRVPEAPVVSRRADCVEGVDRAV